MPAKGSTKLTAQKFNTIKAQLRGKGTVEHIAAANGVKPSTVKAIRRFDSLYDMRADKHRRVQRAAEKQLDAVVSKPENQIPARPQPVSDDELPKYITREELNIVVEGIAEHFSNRIQKLQNRVDNLEAFKDNIKATRLGRMLAKRGGQS